MQKYRYIPTFMLLAMLAALFLLAATLPLHGLFFFSSRLEIPFPWLLGPAHLLFPGAALTPSVLGDLQGQPPDAGLSWLHTFYFFLACLLIFLVYLISIRFLPRYWQPKYILLSTALLGLIFVLMPTVSSQDLYSYIMYARMPTIYHLNPLVVAPTQLQHDPVYPLLYGEWTNQPSVYGPTWIGITSLLQLLIMPFGADKIGLMVLALRLLGLLSHIGSCVLIWQIARRITPYGDREKRLRALFAFAWNPLLLFEACVNAHNDTVMLFLFLLGFWFIIRTTRISGMLIGVALFALASCLKVNIIVILPAILLFLWWKARHWHTLLLAIGFYILTILLLYLPFWQGGAILDVLKINPGTARNINTPSEFLTQFLNSLGRTFWGWTVPENNSLTESIFHTASILIFLALYGWQSWHTLRGPRTLSNICRWLALVWLWYCAFGSPWSWPWYSVLFFGFWALVEASNGSEEHLPLNIAFVRILAFSMLSLYCFYTWGVFVSFVDWLSGFRWAFWRGLWVWGLPIFSIPIGFFLSHRQKKDRTPLAP